MADPTDDKPESSDLTPDEKFRKVLESKWDPAKLSTFMRAREGSRGQRLDASQRSRFEGRFGVDLGDVRIFSGELAEEITKAHNAEALTIGNTGMILMRGSAEFSPQSARGTSLLAHELTHVAQARPSAISRKAVSAELAEENESEAEAEMHEQQVLLEESGLIPEQDTAADKAEKEEKKKQQIFARVLEMYEEDIRAAMIRIGNFDDPKL
jgi:hypothetical protein